MQQLRDNAERAKREFFKAMRDKMLEIDPGLADIVRKQAIERKAWKLWRGEGGLRGLTDEERTKLLLTMEKVDSDPAVEAAKKKRWEANSKDERDAAIENYRKVLRETMLKADPSIAPVLDKLSSEKNHSRIRWTAIREKNDSRVPPTSCFRGGRRRSVVFLRCA